jgi:hypothetical protein
MDEIMFGQTSQEVEKLLASIGKSIKDPKVPCVVFYLMTRTPDMIAGLFILLSIPKLAYTCLVQTRV